QERHGRDAFPGARNIVHSEGLREEPNTHAAALSTIVDPGSALWLNRREFAFASVSRHASVFRQPRRSAVTDSSPKNPKKPGVPGGSDDHSPLEDLVEDALGSQLGPEAKPKPTPGPKPSAPAPKPSAPVPKPPAPVAKPPAPKPAAPHPEREEEPAPIVLD